MSSFNSKNASVKRLIAEHRQILENPDPAYVAGPVGDDLFVWHFSIRGPSDSPFEGGIYHGEIVFPQQYPLKPPDIYFLTPNGRFEIRKKICLTITSFHPDTWNPAWDVRTALTSLIAFFPTKGEGAVGAVESTDPERRALAEQSHNWKCGKCELKFEDAAEPRPAPAPVFEEEEEEPPAPVLEDANAAEAVPEEDADVLKVNFEDLRPMVSEKRSIFVPLLDIPILVLVCIVIWLIANSHFKFVEFFP
jgi:ubiquitin-conjugating enzyme E2 J1